MTDPVSGTSSSNSSSSSNALSAGAAADLGSLTQDYSTFLNLLTTQLKNQDPLSPMDSNQFTQQLVAFSGVEQQIKGNAKLDSLISLQQSANGLTSMLGYIGKEGEVSGTTLFKGDSGAGFSYTLPDLAASATVNILDSTGKVIRSQSVDTSTGKHTRSWAGTDDSGNTVDNGQYTLQVVATKADGSTMANVTTTTTGLISGLQNGTSGVQLYMGTTQVDAGSLIAVGT